MTVHLEFFVIAVALYVVFLTYLFLRVIGRVQAPFLESCRIHGFFAVLCFAFEAAYVHFRIIEPRPWGDMAVGIFFFFCLHYIAFMVVFGQISRGFSLNICVFLFRSGAIPLKTLVLEYGNGQGVNQLKLDRLKMMKKSAVVYENHGFFKLTPFGIFTTKLNRSLLDLWGINYLGKERKR